MVAKLVVARELRGVDAVGVVEGEIGQVSQAGGGDVQVGQMRAGQRACQFRIVPGQRGLHIGARGHRGRIGHGERVGRARIGKEQHGKVEAGAVCLQARIRQVAVALLLLKLCLDDIGVGDLADRLALLGEGGEA